MSDPQPPKSDSQPPGDWNPNAASKQAIRKNLAKFLNPGQSAAPAAGKGMDPKNAALQLHMAQMELANRMRLQANKPENQKQPAPPKPVPPSTPGFGVLGSGHGVFQMGRPNFGQKPSASRPSPYQQVFNQASNPEPTAQEDTPGNSDEVLDVPEDAEFKVNEEPKRQRGKKFRNPSL